MLAVVIGFIVIVTIAASIVAMVAAPRLRRGEDLLTPAGRQTFIRAGQRTREHSASAAGNTVHAVTSLPGRVSSAWAPLSEFLHQQFDRLEGQPGAQGSLESQGSTDSQGSLEPDPVDTSKTIAPAGGSAGIGRPRPVPAESGPIPVDGRFDRGTDRGADRAADRAADRGADRGMQGRTTA